MPMPKPPTSASEISVQTPEENNHEGKHDTEQDDENKNLMNTNKNLPPVMICEKKKKKKILKDFQNQGIIFCVVMLLIAFVAVAVKYGVSIKYFFCSIDFLIFLKLRRSLQVVKKRRKTSLFNNCFFSCFFFKEQMAELFNH